MLDLSPMTVGILVRSEDRRQTSFELSWEGSVSLSTFEDVPLTARVATNRMSCNCLKDILILVLL